MPAPTVICQLVQRFSDHREAYRSGEYNEAQLCFEFLDPFFEALGWDMFNKQGYAEAYKEVIHEDAIRIGGVVKAPDYAFRVGGTRKFFVEAKTPAVDVREEISPAYQLRRYAWSAKLPLSILTDFEEFAVYDCRTKPDVGDKASTGRVLYLRYPDYLEKWEEIAAIFSRESVLKGSFDKYAEITLGKRGTAEVDQAFLAEISHWRDLLARNIALRNTGLSQRELNYAVQMTIDRIIFLRICEDRGIEFYGQLQSLLNGKDVYSRLENILRKAGERYNSGLFHFRKEKDQVESPDELTPGLEVDDKPLKEILGNLYYPDSPYEFSVLPADILGQVYEQFLGKVIRLTAGHHAVIEEKPEVKKAGGVYYTPTYIVEYIVRHTVGSMLEARKPGEKGVGKGEPLRILDPACGSGSFLLGAYQYLLDWYRDGYAADGVDKWAKGKYPTLYQAAHGEWKLTTAERKRILLDHIYGVDIDPQAVEVTKLSLLLKVLEGESEQTLARQLSLWQERALPDLGKNVKCGNSLIGPDFYQGKQMSFLGEEERYRINAFDWEREFPQVFGKEDGGFDLVIGNPPYVRSINLKEVDPILWNLYRSIYKTASEREWDIYLLFVEKGVSVLNSKGRLGFILPNKFLNSQVGKNLRSILTEGKWLRKIVHFGAFQIFSGVTTYTCLLFLVNHNESSLVEVNRYIGPFDKSNVSCQLPENVADYWHTYTISTKELSDSPWEFHASSNELLKRLKKWPKLENFVHIYQGAGTRADKVFLIESRGNQGNLLCVYSYETGKEYFIESSLLKRAFRGRDIGRYQFSNQDNWLIVPYKIAGGKVALIPSKEISALAPRTMEYLLECMPRLNKREKGRFRGQNWYCYGRPQNMTRFGVAEKIIMPDIANRGECFLDTEGRWLLDTAYANVMTRDFGMNLRYFLGILNSPLLSYFLRETGTILRGGYFRMKTEYLKPFPLRPIDFEDPNDSDRHTRLMSLVDRMLSLHQQLAGVKIPTEKALLQRQIEATDREIDALVYELYGLTDEEIGIVEGRE